MKRLVDLLLVALLTLTLVACGAQATPVPPEPTEEAINPGTEIDGMQFASIDEINWDISLAMLCDFDSLQQADATMTVSCYAAPGGSLFFGNCSGVGFDSAEEAEQLWREFKLAVTFDGRPVNLEPFGYLDFDLDSGDPQHARIWNLMVENIAPGMHTVECQDPDPEAEYQTLTYVVTVADQWDIFPTLTADPPRRLNIYSSQKAELAYLLYLPGEYGVDPRREWPLLIYLHGMDRVNTGVEVLRNDYPLGALADQDYFPFIVLAPKGSGGYEFWAADDNVGAVMTLLDEVQSVLAVDARRVYLTGVSAGGNGAWEIGLRHPDRFAALVSAMGYTRWPPAVPENICDLTGVPVWAFHGAQDELIPLEAEQMLVDALKNCGGDVQLTVFPDAGHELSSERIFTSELYDWLLSHSRE